jgi:hypothetical protein
MPMFAEYVSPPDSLQDLVEASDAIVLLKIIESRFIDRTHPTFGSLEHATAYDTRVSDVIKNESATNRSSGLRRIRA